MNSIVIIDKNYKKDFYLLTIEILQEGLTVPKKVYEVYSSSENSTNLIRLNLNILDDNRYSFLKTNISKCASYSIESIINNACLSCEKDYGFYPLYGSNNESFIQCFNSPLEGYYLDTKEKAFKQCYQSCKTCDKAGDAKYHNCINCSNDFKYGKNINGYKNCYENDIIESSTLNIG